MKKNKNKKKLIFMLVPDLIQKLSKKGVLKGFHVYKLIKTCIQILSLQSQSNQILPKTNLLVRTEAKLSKTFK